MSTVTLKHVYKIYDNADKKAAANTKPAVSDFCMEIQDKEFIVFVGPSGCGKSTTLRMIAGLEEITDGEIWIDDTIVNDIAPKDRDIAMVFQNYALYPHMSVYDNMAFGLKLRKIADVKRDKTGKPVLDENGKEIPVMRKYTKQEIDEKVQKAAKILAIEEYLKRKPKALSGGQRQRVALGRTIVRNPKVFLLDEPLSNLDAKLRNQMRAEIIKLRKRINTTFIYVTHDQTEAMTLGDRIVIMSDGFIQQIGTPQEVFNHPYNLFVAGFIGSPQMNFFDAKLLKKDGVYSVLLDGHEVVLSDEKQAALSKKEVEEQDITLGVRPEHIVLSEEGVGGTIDVSEMMGSSVHLHVSACEKDVIIIVNTMNMSTAEVDALCSGTDIKFSFGGNNCHIFNKETGINLES